MRKKPVSILKKTFGTNKRKCQEKRQMSFLFTQDVLFESTFSFYGNT